MADKRVDQLTALGTAPASDDKIPIWDESASAYKYVTKANLVGGTVTGGGTIATGGYTGTIPATGTFVIQGNATSGNIQLGNGFSNGIQAADSGATQRHVVSMVSDNLVLGYGVQTSNSVQISPGGAAVLTVKQDGDSDFSGNVTLVNTTTGSLQTKDSGGTARHAVHMDASDVLFIGYGVQAGASVRIAPGGTSKLTVLESGNVGINDTTPSYKLDVDGDINATGEVRNSGTPLTSDERFKAAVETLAGALDGVKQLRGVSFEWVKAEGAPKKEGRQTGFVAQEVERVFPDLVSEWTVKGEEGEKQTIKCVDYSRMVPVLLEAVKELTLKVEALEAARA